MANLNAKTAALQKQSSARGSTNGADRTGLHLCLLKEKNDFDAVNQQFLVTVTPQGGWRVFWNWAAEEGAPNQSVVVSLRPTGARAGRARGSTGATERLDKQMPADGKG